MGSMYSAVPNASFLGVGDPKVLALGTGDGGSRRGSVGESGCVEAMVDMVEEMDMAEERPEVLVVSLLYDCMIDCMIKLKQV